MQAIATIVGEPGGKSIRAKSLDMVLFATGDTGDSGLGYGLAIKALYPGYHPIESNLIALDACELGMHIFSVLFR